MNKKRKKSMKKIKNFCKNFCLPWILEQRFEKQNAIERIEKWLFNIISIRRTQYKFINLFKKMNVKFLRDNKTKIFLNLTNVTEDQLTNTQFFAQLNLNSYPVKKFGIYEKYLQMISNQLKMK